MRRMKRVTELLDQDALDAWGPDPQTAMPLVSGMLVQMPTIDNEGRHLRYDSRGNPIPNGEGFLYFPKHISVPRPGVVTWRGNVITRELHNSLTSKESEVASQPGLESGVTSQGNVVSLPHGFGRAAPIGSGLGVSLLGIPHRSWLHSTQLIRGEITVIASPGGIGKTSYSLTLSSEVAIGRALLNEKIWGGSSAVLYINAEDGKEELSRRLWALALHHGVTEGDLAKLCVLGADDYRTQRLSFLRTDRGSTILAQEAFDFLELLLDEVRPALVVLDPLIALCGGGNMNDNAIMSLVMRALKKLAIKFNCALLILHHTRKGGDLSSAEAIGGASAIVNLARGAFQLVSMTAEEAGANGVLPSQKSSYFKVVSSKSNLAPAASNTKWYKLCNITLPNAQPPLYPNGDNVQAVEAVSLPAVGSLSNAIDQVIQKAILHIVDLGKLVDGKRYAYSPNITGALNQRALLDDAISAASKAVNGSLQPSDLRAVVKRSIETLRACGSLVVEVIPEGRFRRSSGLRTKVGLLKVGTDAAETDDTDDATGSV